MQHPVAVEHADGAVLHPDRHGPLEEPLHLLRRGGGGQVEVLLLVAEQGVAHRAADAPRLVAGLLETPRDRDHLVGNGDARRQRHQASIPAPNGSPAEWVTTSSIHACDGARGPAAMAPACRSRAPPPSYA